MSSSDKKQPPKKINNSYSLLLKTLSQVEKSKGSSSSNVKKSSSGTSSSPMSNRARQENANSSSAPSNNTPSSSAPSKVTHDDDPDIPDRSYGDYYCKICDSHMNSDNMWEAHVTGKRHIKNVTKGDKDTKYEDLPEVESDIKYELRNVKDPVVGLNYIHEIRRKEPNIPPIYNCFLCHASLATVPLVIEHVLTLKHRLNYLKENDAEKYKLLDATNLKKGMLDSLVLEQVRLLEEKFGRGKVKVKQEKKKNPVVTYSAKKSFDLDDSVDDDIYRKPKIAMADRDVDMWKPIDSIKKSTGHHDRSYSPPPKMNFVPSRSRCKSPGSFKESTSYSYYDDKHDGYKRSFSKRDLSPPRSSHRHDSPERYSKKYDYSHSSRISHSPDRLDYKVTSEYARARSRSPVKAPFNDIKPSFSSNNDYPAPASYLSENYMLPHEKVAPLSSQPISKEEIFKEVMSLPNEQFMKICLLKLTKMDLNGSLEGLVLLSKLINLAKEKFNKNLPSELVNTISNEARKSNSSASLNIPGLGDIGSLTQSSIRTESPLKSSNTLDAQSFINSILRSANVNFPASAAPSSASFPQQNSTFQTSMASSYQAPPVNTYQTPANSYQTTPVNSYSTQNPNLYQHQNVPSHPLPNNAYNNTATAPGLGNAGQPPSNMQRFPYSQYSSAPKNYPRKY